MKLSIVVPVYNVEKYIEETVESLIGCQDTEIILIDDCSPDSSGLICDELANRHKEIRVIHKECNEGLSMARNTGINNAKGEYIAFVDADDKYLETNAIEIILETLNNNSADVFFINMSKWFPNENDRLKNRNAFNEKLNGKHMSDIIDEISKQPSPPISASLKIIRTEILKNNDLYFSRGIFCEDIEWSLRLFSLPIEMAVGYIDVTYLYRQGNQGSISTNISKKNIDDLISIIEKNADKTLVGSAELNPIARILAFELMIAIKLVIFDKTHDKQIIARIKKILKIMKCATDKRVKLTYYCAKIFGIKITSKLLNTI